MKKPNILLILTDQQNAKMMSCADNSFVSTPAMDSLAEEGVRFDRAYCTNPVCIPSRFSLMTGRMPSEIGMVSNRADDVGEIPREIKENCLGFLMRNAGYDAVYAGKVHLPNMTAEDIGFRYICSNERDVLSETCAEFLRTHDGNPFFMVASFINPHDICYMAIRDFQKTEHDKDLLERGAVECAALDSALIKQDVDGDGFFSKHCPPLPLNHAPQADEPEAMEIMLSHRPFRHEARQFWTEKRWREHRRAYARLTEMADAQIGRVLDALRESGHADDTLVIFTSDHGDMDSAHKMEHKSTLYDEACRVPLIIRPPGGMNHGYVDTKHLVSNGLDLLPTICDYGGAFLPEGLKGESLRSLVECSHIRQWRESIPVECATGRGIITEKFKYAMFDIGANCEQLIDLEADPFEQRNALNDSGNSDALNEMRMIFTRTFGDEKRNPSDILRNLCDS